MVHGERIACAEGSPQRALCGGIPSPFLELSPRSWSHFAGIYRQILTTSLKNDFEIPPRRALGGALRPTPQHLTPAHTPRNAQHHLYSVSLTLSHYLSLALSLSLSLAFAVPFSLLLCLSVSVSLSLSLAFALSLALAPWGNILSAKRRQASG